MEFFAKDTHVWRMTAAVFWSILFQFIFLCIYIILANFDLWTLNIFKAPFQAIFSVKTLYIFPLAAIIFLQGIIFSRDYLKPTKTQFIGKRFLILINLFSYQNLTAICMYILLGLSLSYIYPLSNEIFQSISTKCIIDDKTSFEHSSQCLNEEKFFLMLGGIWIGFYTFMKEYVFHSRSLTFPPIQQRKFVRVKAAFFPCLKNAMVKAISPCILFCVVFVFKGHVPRSYFCSFTNLYVGSNPLDTVYIIFNGQLMFYLWMFTTIYLITVDVMFILFNVYLTERANFPVSAFMLQADNNQLLLLQDALSCEKVPIIQHLAFFDLALLSHNDCRRRADLFTISQPGGHPHTWNSIVGECFKVIDKFTDELDKCIGDFSGCNLEQSVGLNQSNKPETIDHSYQQYCYRNMRPLSPRPIQDHDCIQHIECSPVSALYESYERFIKVYQLWFNKKIESFYKTPVIMYFFGEMSEPKVKHLLCQSQPVIWAIHSLSFLVCHSLTEDFYGVAQKDLSNIILSLFHLKNSLDKLQKQSIFMKKIKKLELIDIQMKNLLKHSVKQSIYRIAITFKNYIKDLNLSSEDAITQMMNFVEFKEV